MEPKEMMNLVYWLVGLFVVSNFGNIIMLTIFIFKAGRFVEKTESGISGADSKGTRAHKRIDNEIEGRIEMMEKHENRYHPI